MRQQGATAPRRQRSTSVRLFATAPRCFGDAKGRNWGFRSGGVPQHQRALTWRGVCSSLKVSRATRTLRIVAVVATFFAALSPAYAQTVEGVDGGAGRLATAWQVSAKTCLDLKAAAMEAIAACEQRDVLSKRLMQSNYCAAPGHPDGSVSWRPCDRAAGPEVKGSRGPMDGIAVPTVVTFQRVGSTLVIPITLNGTAQVYAMVDSGATHVQIPEETVEELKRNGSLTDADYIGQQRYTLADGRGVQQRVFRLRKFQIGNGAMINVTAAVGAAQSRTLVGQSFLRRLASWKVDNIDNRLELNFPGPR